MPWFAIDISESCILGGNYHRLCRAFQHAFIQAGAPADMALFAQRGVLDDTRTIYLSPASVAGVRELLDDFDARPCEQPQCNEVTLVYGVPGAKEQLLTGVEELRVPVERNRSREREDAPIYPLSTRKAAAGV